MIVFFLFVCLFVFFSCLFLFLFCFCFYFYFRFCFCFCFLCVFLFSVFVFVFVFRPHVNTVLVIVVIISLPWTEVGVSLLVPSDQTILNGHPYHPGHSAQTTSASNSGGAQILPSTSFASMLTQNYFLSWLCLDTRCAVVMELFYSITHPNSTSSLCPATLDCA